MNATLKKAIRTLQSELPFLKSAKDEFYLHTRRILRRPHESDFKALALIPKSLDGCYVDVGANQGQSIESILLFRPTATIVSFEANSVLASKLTVRYSDRGNVRIIAQGLGDIPGALTLFVPSYKGFVYDGLASFHKAEALSWINSNTVFNFDPSKLCISEVQSTVDTLDNQQLSPIFVKVDVQGYECNVLQGGLQTLRRSEPILLIEDYRRDPRTVELAEQLGYVEHFFDGKTFRKGPAVTGPNSYLLTPDRFKTLTESAY